MRALACGHLLLLMRAVIGVPFYDIDPVDMDIVEIGDKYLGDRVLAYQVGNEPDYYGDGAASLTR